MSEDFSFVITDFETTGFKPKDGHIILELAALHIDMKTCEVRDKLRVVVGQLWAEAALKRPVENMMDDYVTKMHTESGLMEEWQAACMVELDPDAFYKAVHFSSEGGISTVDSIAPHQAALDRGFSQWLSSFRKPKGVVLVGNSVHFDRSFMEEHLPSSTKLLHYRMIDTSAMRMCFREWCEEPPAEVKMAHRAMKDCEASLDTLRWNRQLVQLGHATKRRGP